MLFIDGYAVLTQFPEQFLTDISGPQFLYKLCPFSQRDVDCSCRGINQMKTLSNCAKREKSILKKVQNLFFIQSLFSL